MTFLRINSFVGYSTLTGRFKQCTKLCIHRFFNYYTKLSVSIVEKAAIAVSAHFTT